MVASIGDRSRTGDNHDACFVPDAGLQRDERVVHDKNLRFIADALHDAADDGLVRCAIDAGNAQTNRGGQHARVGQRLFHHVVEHLLERQLAHALQVRALLARRRDHTAVFVGQQAYRLGAAHVDAKNVHSRYITLQ